MRMRYSGTVVSAAVTFLALSTGVALAQTTTPSYPGTTNTTRPSATFTAQFLGTLGPNGFTTQACGFVPGAQVTETLNGNPAGTDTADSAGCVALVIKPAGTALGSPSFAAVMPARLFGAAGTFTTNVSINGRTYGAVTGTNTLDTTGPGSNGASRTVRTTFNIAGADVARGGTIPKTGMMVLRWVGAALALIAVGALIVIADRRRARARIDS